MLAIYKSSSRQKTFSDFHKLSIPSSESSVDVYITIGKYLKLVEDGVISYYENNRQKGKFRASSLKRIKEDFDPRILDIFHLSKTGKGYTLSDAHHRTEAMMQLKKENKISKFEKETMLLRIFPEKDHLFTYRGLNNQEKHKISDHLSNDDFPFGKVLESIVTEGSFTWINAEMRPVLASIVYALCKNLQEGEYNKIRSLRSRVKKEIQSLNGPSFNLKLSTRKRNVLLRSIKYFEIFRNTVLDLCGVTSGKVKGPPKTLGSLIRSSLLFEKIYSDPEWFKDEVFSHLSANHYNTMAKNLNVLFKNLKRHERDQILPKLRQVKEASIH